MSSSKPNPPKNYYQTLGLDAYADLDTVKSAYRKLARQYHPDLNPGNKTAEEHFKLVNEAYDILGDADKKAMFDQTLRILNKDAKPDPKKEPGKPSQEKPPAGKTQANHQKQDKPDKAKSEKADSGVRSINDLFDSFLKKGFSQDASKKDNAKKPESKKADEKVFKPQADKPARGQDVTAEALITEQEAKEGVVKTINVQHNEICGRCSGTGKVSGKVCPTCHGEKIQIRHKKIDVKIPANVKSGSKIRVAGEGGRGAAASPTDQNNRGDNGDLFLVIQIQQPQIDPSLRVEGVDVYGEVSITPPLAVLGGNIQVPTVHGSIQMTLPAQTSSGRVFRLKEQGVHNGAVKGDHFVTVKIVSPETLSPQEKSLYQELLKLQGKHS